MTTMKDDDICLATHVSHLYLISSGVRGSCLLSPAPFTSGLRTIPHHEQCSCSSCAT